MSASDGLHGNVDCIIKLLLTSDGIRCRGSTLDELRKQAVEQGKSQYSESFWNQATLVCADDGCEVEDMESLREKLGKGRDLFFLISPIMSSFLERSVNMDHVMRKYEELKAVGKNIEHSMRVWACEKTRRADLEDIAYARPALLTKRSGESRRTIANQLEQMQEILEATDIDNMFFSL